MPLYGFTCDCGHKFDHLVLTVAIGSSSPKQIIVCEKCGKNSAKKDEINPVGRPVIH